MDERASRDAAEVFDFVDEYLEDLSNGCEKPLATYLARHPGHEEGIAREWLALQHDVASGLHSSPNQASGHQVGPWRLVRELGRGGQGAVWLAEDTRIERRAAVKVLALGHALLDADKRERMRREAEALAKLQHASICPVLEADVAGDTPYIAMRLVEGVSLADALEGARAGNAHELPLPPRTRPELERLLAYFEEVAGALQAAHSAGVVHRDVKPGNLMVTPEGNPMVLDFGQARDENASMHARTLSGEAVGTPAYMSPEQVRGRPSEIDARTDVWSLGATLFECLTLKRPFEGASMSELLRAIEDSPLPSVRSLSGLVSKDLAVVLETALEKDVRRRYATVADLAEDLRRVRMREPVRARPAGPGLRLARWAARHPVIAAALAITVGSLTIGLGLTLNLLGRERVALEFALGSHLAKRTRQLVQEDPAAALALGIEAVEKNATYETRSALLTALDACYLARFLEAAPSRMVREIDISPDGKRVAAALDQGRARVFELDSGAVVADLERGEGPLEAVAFASGGEVLVSAGGDGELCWWRIADGELLHNASLQGAQLDELALDPTSGRVAVSTSAGELLLFDAEGSRQARAELPSAGWNGLCFSPDGARLAAFQRMQQHVTPAEGSRAHLFDAHDLTHVAELGAAGTSISALTFGPRGERVVSGDHSGQVRLWSSEDGSSLGRKLEHPGAIWSLDVSADGVRLAVGCEDGEEARAFLWDLPKATRKALAGTAASRVVHVAFSPRGDRLATTSHDTNCRLFDGHSGAPHALLRGFLLPHRSLWSPDGTRLVTRVTDFNIPVWIARGRRDVYTLRGHTSAVTSARLSADGSRALTVAEDGSARLWNTSRRPADEASEVPIGATVARLASSSSKHLGGCFTPDGRRVLSWNGQGRVELWSARSGARVPGPAPLPHALAQLDPAPDGGHAAAVDVEGRAWCLSLEQGAVAVALKLDGAASLARFTPDGTRILVGTLAGAVHAFAPDGTASGSVDWAPGRSTRVPSVDGFAFHAGSNEVAVARASGQVHFLDTVELSVGMRPDLMVFRSRAIDWNLEGTRLAIVGREGRGALRLHELPSMASVRLEAFHGGNLTCGQFSPDGGLVLSGSMDGTVSVRDTQSGTPVALFEGHAGAVLDARFSRDGGPLRVITGSADGTARIWPVDPLPPARARQPRELLEWERAREARLAAPLRFE